MDETIENLKKEIQTLKEELGYIENSPYIQKSLFSVVYEVTLDREEVMQNEFGKGINEKLGTMFEIKNQAKRLAGLIGLDGDMVRVMINEALQNLLEHGYGRFVEIRFEIVNDQLNPHFIASFKQEMQPGSRYTLTEINKNAMRGDITSEYFDFESSRGRGEFIMKQLTDERRIINGIEVGPDGNKRNYFKRVLVNYKNPTGQKQKINYQDLKLEIDRLDYEDVVCCFHVIHRDHKTYALTVASMKSAFDGVVGLMKEHGFTPEQTETYYRTIFATFFPDHEVNPEELLSLFTKVRQIVYAEQEAHKK
jgi:anti-sigma regulatory factor (Ser/Thr protein kinase)